MGSENSSNRVETALSQWKAREDRLSKLFSFSLSLNAALLKEKLRYYEMISAKYRGTNSSDERFALRIVAQERRSIEKQLYANLLVRLFRRLVVLPFRTQLMIRHEAKQVENDIRTLHDQLQRAGFKDLSARLSEQVGKDLNKFTIRVSHYANEKERLDYELSFSKDQAGRYQFGGYKASLYNDANPEDSRQQFFNAEYQVDKTEAHNLLAGRSVNKEGTWKQLDFNDRDALGNYRIKEFPSAYGFSLESVVDKLPIRELQSSGQADKVYGALNQGNRHAVSFIKDGNELRYYIEANPRLKTVNIYDEHSRKVTLNTALGNTPTEGVKLAQNENLKENHSNRKGMRVT